MATSSLFGARPKRAKSEKVGKAGGRGRKLGLIAALSSSLVLAGGFAFADTTTPSPTPSDAQVAALAEPEATASVEPTQAPEPTASASPEPEKSVEPAPVASESPSTPATKFPAEVAQDEPTKPSASPSAKTQQAPSDAADGLAAPVSDADALADVTPTAITGNSCSYANAGTGSHARTICWLDFTGFDSAGSDVTEPVSITLPGGYELTATLSSVGENGGGNSSNNRYRSRYVRASAFPTWVGENAGAFLGNTLNGVPFYTGVAGKPALYQYRENTGSGQNAGHTLAVSTVTLSNIQLKLNGVAVQGYSLVVADAETTDNNESIDWTTTGGNFAVLPNSPGNNMGNACTPTFTNYGSTAKCAANNNSFKSGTAMLTTAAPGTGTWSVSQKFTGVGLEGVAFGLMFAKASAEVVMDGRIASADQFTVSMQASQLGAQSITALTTGTAPAGGTAQIAERELVVPVGQSAPITYGVTGTASNWATDYTEAWVCTRGGTNIYTGSTAPASNVTTVSVGQLVHCKVTLTSPKLTLQKNVQNSFGGTAVPTDWTLSATGLTPISGVTGATTVTSVPVKVGTYALSESTGPAGYEPAGWVCNGTSAGQTGTGSVSIVKGSKTTCVVTNKDQPGTLKIVKGFDNSVPNGSGNIAFNGAYTCTIPGKAAATGTWTVNGAGAATLTPTNGSSAADKLPKGATCSATETQPTGSGGLPNSSYVWDTYTVSSPVTIVANQTGTITVTNKAKRVYGNFAVTKVVPAGSLVDAGRTFNGGWSCTLGAEALTGTWGPIAAGATWTSTANSIPLGATCTATEARTGEPVTDGSHVWDGDPIISGPVTVVTGSTATITVTNKTKPVPGTVAWVKVAKGGQTPLNGSAWKIVGPASSTTEIPVTDCVAANAAGCTGADKDPAAGKFLVKELAWGTYKLFETQAPPGYLGNATPVSFTIGRPVGDVKLTWNLGNIENQQRQAPILPLTGGIGRDQIYLAGAAVLFLAMAAYGTKRYVGRRHPRSA